MDDKEVAHIAQKMEEKIQQLMTQHLALKAEYDNLWKVLIVLLDHFPEKTAVFHNTQFKRPFDLYTVERNYNESENLVSFTLVKGGKDS